MKLLQYLFIILIILLFACKKDTPSTPDLGYDYRPLQVGSYIIYNVDSIVYDDFFTPTKIDTFNFLIKEKIETRFTDASGNLAYKLYRYKKESDTTQWFVKDVWFLYVEDNKRLIQDEENIKYVKLIFPPHTNDEWDGNAQNTLSEQTYFYESVHSSESVGNLKFDSVITVNQNNYTTNLIYEKHYYEKYAKHIGMVYKEIYDVKKDISTQEILAGLNYKMTIRSYGKE